jgi:hypothetical protein
MDTLENILKEEDGIYAILFVVLALLIFASVTIHQIITWVRQRWSLEERSKRHRERTIQFLRASLQDSIRYNQQERLQITHEIKKEK